MPNGGNTNLTPVAAMTMSSTIDLKLNKMTGMAYNAEKIDPNLTFNRQAKGEDLKSGQMKILVYLLEDDIKKDNSDFSSKETDCISHDIICHICKDICFVEFNEYTITFFGKAVGLYHKITVKSSTNYKSGKNVAF